MRKLKKAWLVLCGNEDYMKGWGYLGSVYSSLKKAREAAYGCDAIIPIVYQERLLIP